MKEIFSVWSKTRQIVIIAITAAIYASTLIPFKAIQIIPGFVELRPASVFPILFGIMFGPAAAWGSAIGNVIGDAFGTLSLASIFGFFGNFFFSYTAFVIWKSLVKDEDVVMNLKQISVFTLASIASSVACAAIICAGLYFLKILQLNVVISVFVIIIVNNTLMGSVLGAMLMKLLYRRIKNTGLTYKTEND
jgi:energy-coupling factor transport system substrate-specific component